MAVDLKQKVNVGDVFHRYRVVLGRDPDPAIIQKAEAGKLSMQALLEDIRGQKPASREQRQQFLQSLGWKPQEITREYNRIKNKEVNALPTDRDSMLGEVEDLVTDLVEGMIGAEEEALSDIGVFEFDEEAVREAILNDPNFQKYVQDKYDILDRQIREGKIATQDDFEASKRRLMAEASQKLQKISITKAQTEEELRQKLANIKGQTQFSLGEAKRRWAEKYEKTEETELDRGRGFSGVMLRHMEDVVEGRQAELGEIRRERDVARQAAKTEAHYDLKRAKVAREGVLQNRKVEMDIAKRQKAAGERKYGDVNKPRQVGWHGKEQRADIKSQRETLLMTEIEAERKRRREDFTMLHGQTIKGAEGTATTGSQNTQKKKKKT